MVRDTGSPPFIVDGNINIGGESGPVKGPDRPIDGADGKRVAFLHPDAGHGVLIEYPGDFNAAVLAFLCAFPAYFGTNGVIAYVAVTSIATIGLYIAYAIPIYLRLRAGDSWEPGEWTLGRWYRLIGTIACIWVAFISVLFILPVAPAGIPFKSGFTWVSFNYAPIAVVGTMLIVGGWWFVSAHKWFKGPISQGSEEELARIEAEYGETTPPVATPAS